MSRQSCSHFPDDEKVKPVFHMIRYRQLEAHASPTIRGSFSEKFLVVKDGRITTGKKSRRFEGDAAAWPNGVNPMRS